ncbi:metal-dependent hydrolase [Acidobacteria bacterium AH-259-D05]|nr:metal-dependent hydrolase [Acidobacteria bacterium AH-259-D05]
MNKKTHIVVGMAGAGLAVVPLCEKQGIKLDPGLVLIAAIAGLVGGRLPDLIEPESHPNHRQLGHSASIGALLIKVASDLFDDDNCPTWLRDNVQLRVLFISVVAGYLSHLALDSLTKKGLPLLDKGTAISFAKLLSE